jgi:hypothetical protein
MFEFLSFVWGRVWFLARSRPVDYAGAESTGLLVSQCWLNLAGYPVAWQFPNQDVDQSILIFEPLASPFSKSRIRLFEIGEQAVVVHLSVYINPAYDWQLDSVQFPIAPIQTKHN